MFGLFLFDVYVSQLTLNKEVYLDTGGEKLLAKVAFLDFPPTEIKERKRFRKDDDDLRVYQFNNGQSIHFSMSCEELVTKMKRALLSIGIFKVDDSFPVCSCQTQFGGCACDLGSLRVEDPAPYTINGPFELFDSGKSFAGQLDLDITISCLGRCLVSRYILAPKCFLFKTEVGGREYVGSFREPSKQSTGTPESQAYKLISIGSQTLVAEKSLPGNLMKDIAGVSPMANHLAEGSVPKPPRVLLFDPSKSRRKSRKKKGKKGKKKKGRKKK